MCVENSNAFIHPLLLVITILSVWAFLILHDHTVAKIGQILEPQCHFQMLIFTSKSIILYQFDIADSKSAIRFELGSSWQKLSAFECVESAYFVPSKKQSGGQFFSTFLYFFSTFNYNFEKTKVSPKSSLKSALEMILNCIKW